jgi:HlyD family secretion protein
VDALNAWVTYWEAYATRVRTLAQQSAESETELERAIANLNSTTAEVGQREQNAISQSLFYKAAQLLPKLITDYLQRKKLQGDVLRRQLQEAQTQLQQASLRKQRATMFSPVDGVVLKRELFSEQYVRAGTLLLTIGSLNELEIEAEILTQEAAAIREGHEVDIYGPALGRDVSDSVPGNVRRVLPDAFTKVSSLGVEEQRVKVIVALDDLPSVLQERPGLGVGFRVRVRVYTDARQDVVAVPRSALFHNEAGGWAAFVVRDSRALQQNVEVGLMNDEWAEIRSGITEGETVIVAPESTLAEGVRVQVRQAPERRPLENDE